MTMPLIFQIQLFDAEETVHVTLKQKVPADHTHDLCSPIYPILHLLSDMEMSACRGCQSIPSSASK